MLYGQSGSTHVYLHNNNQDINMKILASILINVVIISSVNAFQSESEEVSLGSVYDFFSSELTQKRFYVQLVFQVKLRFGVDLKLIDKMFLLVYFPQCWLAHHWRNLEVLQPGDQHRSKL